MFNGFILPFRFTLEACRHLMMIDELLQRHCLKLFTFFFTKPKSIEPEKFQTTWPLQTPFHRQCDDCSLLPYRIQFFFSSFFGILWMFPLTLIGKWISFQMTRHKKAKTILEQSLHKLNEQRLVNIMWFFRASIWVCLNRIAFVDLHPKTTYYNWNWTIIICM